jgi:predicted transcriptional regulator
MPKRTYNEIRKDILAALLDGDEHTFGDLERKVNTNWQTIRNQCKDLQTFKAVTITENKVKITASGRDVLKQL